MAKTKRTIAKSAAVTKNIETALASLGTACVAGDSAVAKRSKDGKSLAATTKRLSRKRAILTKRKRAFGEARQGCPERRDAQGPSGGDQGAGDDEDPAGQGARGEGGQRCRAGGAQSRAAPGNRLREGDRAGREVAQQAHQAAAVAVAAAHGLGPRAHAPHTHHASAGRPLSVDGKFGLLGSVTVLDGPHTQHHAATLAARIDIGMGFRGVSPADSFGRSPA